MRRGAAPLLLLLVLLAAAAAAAAAVPRCPPGATECQFTASGVSEYSFKVNGVTVLYKMEDSKFFYLKCPTGVTLENPALPRFEPSLRVFKVAFECPSPTGSYADILNTLNIVVKVVHTLNLSDVSLRSGGLVGLSVQTLQLQSVRIEPQAFAAMSGIRNLKLENTNITDGDLQQLPVSLDRLTLVNTHIGVVSRAALTALPALNYLVVRESSGGTEVRVHAAGTLKGLTLDSPASVDLVEPELPDNLENLTLRWWAARHPVPWRSCRALKHLEVHWGDTEALPGHWLARCTNLQELSLKLNNLRTLNETALHNASALQVVRIVDGALEVLPAALLDDAKSLRILDLSGNKLHELPSGVFAVTRSLELLLLSDNQLRAETALKPLEGLSALQKLHLDDNAALDACPRRASSTATSVEQGRSPLRELNNLTLLSLKGTNTSQLCADWHDLRSLEMLDLSHTAITSLSYTDVQFNTAKKHVILNLTGSNVTRLIFGKVDYESALAKSARPAVTLLLSLPLHCDCELYWAASALAAPAPRLSAPDALCSHNRPLAAVPPEEMQCEMPEPECPEGCSCALRPDRGPKDRVLSVRCEGAHRTSVPDLGALLSSLKYDLALELHLAGNQIKQLRPDDLPPKSLLKMLDLRNNSLSIIGEKTAKALRSRPSLQVLLAGNQVDCGCAGAAALATVRASPEQFPDRGEAVCADGGSLLDAAARPPPECGLSTEPAGLPSGAVAGLATAAFVAAAAAVGLLLARPELRLRLKAALRARGLLPRAAEADDGRSYDAFLSFSHADWEVVREVVAELESGAAPLRLCVHYRDWAPGGWIPAQIAASVRASRRTVVLVSEHFLQSAWARAEFREAHAAALRDAEPRLVVVLLAEPAELPPLDRELRTYLATNTYVRWGDPWFWDKLRRALPAPRDRVAPDVRAAPPDVRTASHAIAAEQDSVPARDIDVDASVYTIPSPPDASPAALDYVRLEPDKGPGALGPLLAAPSDLPRPDATPAGA